MINDEPDARGLVAIALQSFRDSILPVVPAEQRFEALMIANALSIAERELAAEPELALTGRMLPEIEQDLLRHLDGVAGRKLFGRTA